MNRSVLLARAVAYEASRSERFYSDLPQEDLELFWGEVHDLRHPRTLLDVISDADRRINGISETELLKELQETVA